MAVVVDPLEGGARRVGKDELVHRCRRCWSMAYTREEAVGERFGRRRQKCGAAVQKARRCGLQSDHIPRSSIHSTVACPAARKESARSPERAGRKTRRPGGPPSLPPCLVLLTSAPRVSARLGAAPKCWVPGVARSLAAGSPGLIRGSGVSDWTGGVRVSPRGRQACWAAAPQRQRGGAGNMPKCRSAGAVSIPLWFCIRLIHVISSFAAPSLRCLRFRACSALLQSQWRCDRPSSHEPSPMTLSAAADAAPAGEPAPAAGPACTAAAANGSSPDPSQPSTVEAAFPGSFCATGRGFRTGHVCIILYTDFVP